MGPVPVGSREQLLGLVAAQQHSVRTRGKMIMRLLAQERGAYQIGCSRQASVVRVGLLRQLAVAIRKLSLAFFEFLRAQQSQTLHTQAVSAKQRTTAMQSAKVSTPEDPSSIWLCQNRRGRPRGILQLALSAQPSGGSGGLAAVWPALLSGPRTPGLRVSILRGQTLPHLSVHSCEPGACTVHIPARTQGRGRLQFPHSTPPPTCTSTSLRRYLQDKMLARESQCRLV
eukprot:1810444-Rhodomonas_salina.3